MSRPPNVRRAFSVLSTFVLLVPLALGGCRSLTEADDLRQQILRQEDTIEKAWSTHDTASVSPIIADDLQFWSYSGQRRGKADLLRSIQKAADSTTTRVTDPIVRIYGDTAIYTAHVVDSSRRPDGSSSTAHTCVTDIFVKRGQTWQLVASHETLLPEQITPASR